MTSTTTVFRNGLIFTGREDATSPFERDIVVAIKNDSIIFVGNETDVQAEQIMQERDVVVVDLQSRSLLPGLIDRSVRSSCVQLTCLMPFQSYAPSPFRGFSY